MHRYLFAIIALFLQLVPQISSADIVYDNMEGAPNSAYYSDIGFSTQFIADEFTLNNNTSLSRISWSGIYNDASGADFFEIRLMVDASGQLDFRNLHVIQPGPVTRTDTGQTLLNRTLYEYSVDISGEGITLDANREYWITIINETQNLGWSWSVNERNGTLVYNNTSSGFTNQESQGAMDFILEGSTIPEPSSFLMFFAFVAHTSIRRRKPSHS